MKNSSISRRPAKRSLDPAEEGITSLLRTTDRVRVRLGIVLAPHDITLAQYNVLRILRGAGDEPLPTLEIASRTIERSPGITRLLDRLDEKGLVHRQRCASDRRQVLCSITAAGLDLLAALDEPVLEDDREILSGLSAADLDTLVQLLHRVRNGAEPVPSSGGTSS